MSTYNDATILGINPGWSDNAAPLNQSREKTRDDIRRILNFPVTLDGINTVTRAMNTVAELSPETVAYIESALVEHAGLESQRTTTQSSPSWDGAAPIKKADVIEYDTSLLSAADAVVTQTQGFNARMGQIEMEIRVALNLQSNSPGGRLFRS